MSIAFYNGLFCKKEEVKIPLTDRSVFFGDGIYDAAIGKNGKIYLKDEHVDRFFRNAEKMDIKALYSRDELSKLLDEAVKKSNEDCFFIYFQLTRSSPERKHAYDDSCTSNLLITVTKQEEPSYKRLKLVTAEDLRYYYCNIKTLNLLPSVLASGFANKMSADEAVFHRGDTVTECAHSNISIIKNGKLKTHPNCCMILPGIGRQKLIEKCEKMEIDVDLSPFTLDELYQADEVLITSSSKICMRAESVNGVSYRDEANSLGKKLCESLIHDFYSYTKKEKC